MNGDEVDYTVEAIIAVLFMLIGIFGISYMILTLEPQVSVRTTVDKVRVNAVDFNDESYPFNYTGYQAYMFAWMMDGTSDVPLTWVGSPDDKFPIPSGATEHSQYITMKSIGSPPAFLVKRNQAIVGVDDFNGTSVRDAIRSMAKYTHAESATDVDSVCVQCFYNPNRGCSGHAVTPKGNPVRLSFTDGKECNDSDGGHKYATDTDNNYERYDYVWMLHPCNVS